jgi:hypothetical protein
MSEFDSAGYEDLTGDGGESLNLCVLSRNLKFGRRGFEKDHC